MGSYPMCLKSALSVAVPCSVHRRLSRLLIIGIPSRINVRGSNFWKEQTRVKLFGVVCGHVASVRSRNDLAIFNTCRIRRRTPVPASVNRGGKTWIQYLREPRKERMAGLV